MIGNYNAENGNVKENNSKPVLMKHRLRIEAATTFIEIYITLSGGSHKFSKNTQSFVKQSYHPRRWSLGANQLSGAKSGLNRFTRNRVLVT